LKKLLVDYPSGLNTHFTIQDQDYHIRVIIADKDLIISWKLISEEIKNHAKTQFKIENYEMYDSGMLTNQIKNSLNNSGIDISKSATAQEEIDRIVYTLFNDTSIIWCSSIQKLGDKYLHGDRPKDTFALILRDLINAKAKFNKKDLTEIIHKFLSREYKLPFFRRLVLYIISQNWADYNKVFWDMVKNNDEAGYFSSEHFRKEIYYLLNNNIQLFNGEERKQLQQIIEKGPQEDRRDRGENYTDYWKLEWYSAMKDDQDYSEKYRTLSKKLEVTYDHYEKLGEIEIRWGSQSPFSLEDLIKMDNSHIVRNIFNFQPKNIWEDPSVDGFADMLGKAVQERPEKFANELERYHGIYFIYAYYILKGFTDAWRNKKPFNWENVLNYCLNYIISPGFKTDELKLENDSWRVDRKWIVGAVGNLISEGTQKDSNAFNTSLLPLTKKILLVLIPELDAADDLKVTKIDYPTYSLNSTAGKLLRALLDYSLRYARLYGSTEEKKWDDTLKALFEETLQKGIIDGYILQGMYIQQFIYLDKNWIINQIKKYYKLEEKFWVGFMGGYLFNHIIDNKELYKLMIPHFKRIIQFKGDFKDLSISDVAKHIAGHYLLGYESINKDSLIRKFTTEGKARQIISLVQFIWTQKEYYNSLEEQKKNFLRDRVFDLWKYILNRFKEDKSENTLKLISDLSKFAVYIEEINSENIEFLKTSAEVINTNYNSSFFIEELMRLKDKGNPEITAHYIGELFKLMLLNSTPDYDQETIKLIVTFLYKNKATKKEIKGMADDICNEYGKRGYLFLREIYNQYN